MGLSPRCSEWKIFTKYSPLKLSSHLIQDQDQNWNMDCKQKIFRHHEKILLYLKHDGCKNFGSFPSWCDLWLLLWCFGVKWQGGPQISHHFWSKWRRRLRHFWDGRRKCQAKTFLYLSKMKNVSRDEHFLQKIKFYCPPFQYKTRKSNVSYVSLCVIIS